MDRIPYFSAIHHTLTQTGATMSAVLIAMVVWMYFLKKRPTPASARKKKR